MSFLGTFQPAPHKVLRSYDADCEVYRCNGDAMKTLVLSAQRPSLAPSYIYSRRVFPHADVC